MSGFTFAPANQNSFMTTITTTSGTITVWATPSTVYDDLNAALAAGTTTQFRQLMPDGDGFVGRNPADVVTVNPSTVTAVS